MSHWKQKKNSQLLYLLFCLPLLHLCILHLHHAFQLPLCASLYIFSSLWKKISLLHADSVAPR